MSEVIIETRNLTKEYVRDEFHVIALKDVSLTKDVKDAAFEFRPEPWLREAPVDLDKAPVVAEPAPPKSPATDR